MKQKQKIILGLIVIGAIALTWAIYVIFPFGMSAGSNYFDPIGERKLQPDEEGQFNYVYQQYLSIDITGDEFRGWDNRKSVALEVWDCLCLLCDALHCND